MKAHWQYLKYVLRHRWYVFWYCVEYRIIWRGMLHDWTKFLPVEWGPYVERFYGKGNSVAEAMQDLSYQYAWNHHQKKNDHHWQHWMLNRDDGSTLILPMSDNARKEMLCDWLGMGKMFRTDTLEWYESNKHTMTLNENTREWIEGELARRANFARIKAMLGMG